MEDFDNTESSLGDSVHIETASSSDSESSDGGERGNHPKVSTVRTAQGTKGTTQGTWGSTQVTRVTTQGARVTSDTEERGTHQKVPRARSAIVLIRRGGW